MKILLVDDDKDLCHLTSLALTKHGHEVSVFHEAKQALQYAKINKPNLIFMDVMLPGMDGGEAAKVLKADAQLKNIPVVFLTGLITGTGKEKGLENTGLNIDGVQYLTLGKPYEIEDLLEVVDKNAR